MGKLRESFLSTDINKREIGRNFITAFELLDDIWEGLVGVGDSGNPVYVELGIQKEADKFRDLVARLKEARTAIMIRIK